MSVSKLLLRFGLLYSGLLAVMVIAVGLFGLQKPTSFNVVLLLVSTMWVCAQFAQKNGAPLRGTARLQAIAGMFAIDMAAQLLGAVSVAPPSPPGPMAFALIAVGALHLLGIYVGTWAAAKQFAKQAEKASAKAALSQPVRPTQTGAQR